MSGIIAAVLIPVASLLIGWHIATREAKDREARLERELRWIHNHHRRA